MATRTKLTGRLVIRSAIAVLVFAALALLAGGFAGAQRYLWADSTGAVHRSAPRPEEPAATSANLDDDSDRRLGWELATRVVQDALASSDPKSFPGLQAFMQDFRSQELRFDPKLPSARWPSLDADVLLSRNPNFWRAYYEVAPGDPAWLIMHASLLLSAGDASRSAYVLVLARQRPPDGQELSTIVEQLVARATETIDHGNVEVQAGIALFDRGDRSGAARKYREVLARWPKNGWAHYELAYTLRTQQAEAAAQKPEQAVQASASPEVSEEFALARRHDPFEWHAYQGTDRAVIQSINPLVSTCLPAWEKLARAPGRVGDDVLLQFAEGCQEAGVNELALVARQILVARRGRFDPSDHPFIARGLRSLVPGQQTEAILARLAEERVEVRQLTRRAP